MPDTALTQNLLPQTRKASFKKKNTGEDTGEAVSYTILKFSGIRLVKHSVLRHTPFIFNCFQIKREKKKPFSSWIV